VGFVRVKGLIGTSREALREVEFLADSGSFHTVVSPDLASELGITPAPFTTRGVLADKRVVEMPLALAYLRILDREAAILVGIFDVPMPLLGATSLEALGLKVDPIKGTFEPVLPWPLLL